MTITVTTDKCGTALLQTINFVHKIDKATGSVLTEWGGGSIFLDGEDRMIEIRSNNKIRYLNAKISHITLKQAGNSLESYEKFACFCVNFD